MDPSRVLQIPAIPGPCLHFTPCFAMLRSGSSLGPFASIANTMHLGSPVSSGTPWDPLGALWGCPWNLLGVSPGAPGASLGSPGASPGHSRDSLSTPGDSPGTPRGLPGAFLRSPGVSPGTSPGFPGYSRNSRDSLGTLPALPWDSPGSPGTPRGLLGLPRVLGVTPVWTHADTYPRKRLHTHTPRDTLSRVCCQRLVYSGSPYSMNMLCPHKIGRESWVWEMAGARCVQDHSP